MVFNTKLFTMQVSLIILIGGCGNPYLKKAGRNSDEAIRNIFDPVAGAINGKTNDGKRPEEPRPSTQVPKFNLSVDRYDSCDALQADIRSRLEARRVDERRYEAYQAAMEDYWKSSGSSNKVSASEGTVSADMESVESEESEESFTNTQEKGVDEADAFKIGKNHLFTPGHDGVEVVTRASLVHLGRLDMSGIDSPLYYSDGDRFIVVGQKVEKSTTPCDYGYELKSAGPSYREPCQNDTTVNKMVTVVRIYDAANAGALPVLYLTREFTGDLFDSRFINGHLIIVQNDYMWIQDPAFQRWGNDGQFYYAVSSWPYQNSDLNAPVPDRPVEQDASGQVRGIPCNQIMRQTVGDYDFRMTKVVSINTRASGAPDQSGAILGGGDSIYMSTDNLYITKSGMEWYRWDYESGRSRSEELVITKVAFDGVSGAVKPVAAGNVIGRIKDQWAFKDYPSVGAVAVATSTGQLWNDGELIAQNHLWILKNQEGSPALEIVSSVRDFGTGEDIRSVRYVGNMAYIVTFKKTDPLFSIDMTNPLAPKMLGELKVPGFSVYMHPVAAGRLVGVGFDAFDEGTFAWYQGIQVSLFDVTDPLGMKRIDNKIIGDRGSSSEVTADHKAFFYDQESRIMAIPAIELTGAQAGTSEYGRSLAFSGAIIYRVGDQLDEIARISHQNLIPSECRKLMTNSRWWQDKSRSLDINRVFLVDGRLLSMSSFGIKAHDPTNPALELATVAFENPDLCQFFRAGW